MIRPVRFLISVTVFAILLVAIFFGFAVVADPVSSQQPALELETDFDADTIQLDVAVNEDGNGEWTISFWLELDDSESQAAFESVQAEIEEDPESQAQQFASRIEQTVTTATEATGREMSVSQFTVSAERQSLAREFGVVRYSFAWSGFAERDDEDTLHVGDAISGLFLDEDTRLRISWPETHELHTVTPDPNEQDATAVSWSGGETDFASDEPRVILVPESSGTAVGMILAGFGGGILLLGLFGLWMGRRNTVSEPAVENPDSPSGGEQESRKQQPTQSEQASEQQSREAEQTDSSGTGSDSLPTDSDSLDASEFQDPLLSNEEQVMRLLEANGGRIKQQRVVEELDWTAAKTSKVVSGLRDENKIESFRIGRENVLTLPEFDDE